MLLTPRSVLFIVACLAGAACTGVAGDNSAKGAGEDGAGGNSRDGQGEDPDFPDFVPGRDGASSPATASCEKQTSLGAGKWRRLTRRQYRNTVKDLLGIDADTKNFLSDSTTGAFATNTLPPQPNDISAYAEAAEAIAAKAVTDPGKLTGCNVATTGDDACAAKFIKEFGARAYRHELSAAEVKVLTETYNVGKTESFAAGLELVLRAMLMSPSFLYVVEFGASPSGGIAKLTSTEVATRLGYLLWNTTPDSALMAAASGGELDTVQGIQTQAKRLMKDPRFGATLGDFHAQLFHLGKLTDGTVQKSNAPEFDRAMQDAMVNEVNAFVAHAFANGQATVKNLFTSPYVFPAGPLMGLYKVTPSQLVNGRYEVKDGTRAGLLTSPALMATEPPIPTAYGIVHRGKMVRTMLLCETLPPPPPNLKFASPPDAATTPQRDLLDQHKNEPSCAGCHTLMDPIGFGFENFDQLGRYRTTYPKGESINASGEVVGESDVQGKFSNAAELSAKLATSQQVRACLGTHWFRYSYGREPSEDDACVVDSFATALGTGDGHLPSAMLSFVATDAFRFRRGVQ